MEGGIQEQGQQLDALFASRARRARGTTDQSPRHGLNTTLTAPSCFFWNIS